MKVVFWIVKDSISNTSQSKLSRFSIRPTESEVEFGLQFPQPLPRRGSNAENFYKLDELTGKMKGTTAVSGGAYGIHDDPIYQELPYDSGDIVVQKTFETSTKKMDLNNHIPVLERYDVSRF